MLFVVDKYARDLASFIIKPAGHWLQGVRMDCVQQ